MTKPVRIAVRLLTFAAIWFLTLLLFVNLQDAGIVSPRLAGIYVGSWVTIALFACFPSLPIPNRD